jgi:tRNA threonylcarbamoyladenosine biosynthesis protein TsaB
VAEYTWQAAGRHTAQLLPTLDGLCRAVNLPVETWSAVAVATGPGSFNGIRTGIAAALGLALGAAIPLVGVGTLDVLAYQAFLCALHPLPSRQALLCAVLPAGRGEFYYAAYQPERAAGTRAPWAAAARAGDPAVGTPDDLAAALGALAGARREPVLVCGVASDELVHALGAALGQRACFAPPAASLRRATYLALLAQQHLQAGGEDQLLSVRPIYLRRVAVTRSRHPFAGAASGGG